MTYDSLANSFAEYIVQIFIWNLQISVLVNLKLIQCVNKKEMAKDIKKKQNLIWKQVKTCTSKHLLCVHVGSLPTFHHFLWTASKLNYHLFTQAKGAQIPNNWRKYQQNITITVLRQGAFIHRSGFLKATEWKV